MLDAAATAVEPDRKRRASEKVRSDLRALFETLSPCECEVMALVSSGLMNEQIAAAQALEGGALCFLNKPFQPAALIECFSVALSRCNGN
jgi:FixJ family two-component response regulator